jgi:ankyrin repeat protein
MFSGRTAKVLWINGPAGYGKTVLCARIIQHLKEAAPAIAAAALPPSPSLMDASDQLIPGSKLAYYFFSAELEPRGDPLVIVRSWIAQLVASSAEAHDVALRHLPTSEAGSATAADVWRLFAVLVRVVPLCSLVVDGLDECVLSSDDAAAMAESHFPGDSRRASFLAKLKRAIGHTETRVLVVSRDERDIRSELRYIATDVVGPLGSETMASRAADGDADVGQQVEDDGPAAHEGENGPSTADTTSVPPATLSEWRISAGDVQRDVALYARSIVERQLPRKDAALRESLAAHMTQTCDGMFLWLRQQAPRLRSGRNRKQLEAVVQQVPPGLHRLYDANWAELRRLEPSDMVRALAILRWATFALRPLTVLEITHALVIGDDDADDGGSGDFGADELPDDIDVDYVNDQLVDICCSLIEVRSEGRADDSVVTSTLHLAHFSVRQYLTAASPPSELEGIGGVAFSDEAAQQAYLARLCLRYLSNGSVWEHGRDAPFLRYAADAWHQHGGPHTKGYHAVVGPINKFFDITNLLWDSWRDFFEQHMVRDIDSPVKEGQPASGSRLYYAALFGLGETAELLLSRCKPGEVLEAVGGRYGTPIQAAAANGHLPLVERFAALGADVNAPGGRWGSALNAAAVGGYEDIVRYLLGHGAKWEAKDGLGRNALYMASKAGHTSIVGVLLDRGASLSVTDEQGGTPLHSAAYNGHYDTVRLCLDRGAPVDNVSKRGWTPMCLAVMRRHIRIVSRLLDCGADTAVADDEGRTPLIHASIVGDIGIAELLINAGADVQVGDRRRITPLHFASEMGHGDMVTLLLHRGADQGAVAENHLTPLLFAASKGRTDIVHMLIIHGADVNHSSSAGYTPLFEAARNGHNAVVRLLLGNGSLTNLAGANLWTPLIVASARGHLEIVKDLLRHGADLTAMTDKGTTALIMAARNGHVDVVQHLLDGGADLQVQDAEGWSTLHKAAKEGHTSVVRSLVDRGASLEAKTNNDATALHLAVWNGNFDVAKFLLGCGADPNTRGYGGYTPLLAASAQGHMGIARLLVEHGAHVGARAFYGLTPLLSAARAGHTDIVSLLLDHGAPTSAAASADCFGCGPLHAAAEAGHLGAADLLLARSAARLDERAARCGSTPLHFALHTHRLHVVEALLARGASPRVRDVYGRTALEWARIYGVAGGDAPQLAALALAEADADTAPGDGAAADAAAAAEANDRRRLEASAARLAADLRAAAISDKEEVFAYLFLLGKCLLFVGDIERAKVALATAMGIAHGYFGCKSCMMASNDALYVCSTCYDVELCAACLKRYNGGGKDKFFWCESHEFFLIKQDALLYDESTSVDGPVVPSPLHEWIKSLLLDYSKKERTI